MKTLYKSIVVSLVLLVSSINLTFLATGIAGAVTARGAACESAGGSWDGRTCTDGTGGTSVNDALAFALNLLSAIAGIIATIAIIVSGIKFMTSGGDPQSTVGARRTLIFAIVGLMIIVLSQLMVRFVLSRII